jgi:hypothetical protein
MRRGAADGSADRDTATVEEAKNLRVGGGGRADTEEDATIRWS